MCTAPPDPPDLVAQLAVAEAQLATSAAIMAAATGYFFSLRAPDLDAQLTTSKARLMGSAVPMVATMTALAGVLGPTERPHPVPPRRNASVP
jgi:hypothetical protein